MPDLNPAPDTLGLSSPALGPWFAHNSDPLPTLPLPAGDLSIPLTLSVDMEWHAPANCTASYAVATAARPAGLRSLRQENGSPAFTNGNLVVLLTLLPEAEMRLWALTQPIPAPDGTAAPTANTPARPRVRYLAMEIPIANAPDIDAVETLRNADLPGDLATDDDRAQFLGFTGAGALANADNPVQELRRPNTDSAIALRNRTGAPLPVQLWCFDYLGRPLDPGAVANWWTFMASTGIWDNLWVDDAATTKVTASPAPGRIVHITNAHEGPLSTELQGRLDLTDLTQTAGATNLYQAGAAPVIALTAAPDPDDAPIPRLAALPLGNYADPGTATPFSGWTDAAFPAAITRDFVRIGCLDIEQHLTGLTRADPVQADARQRVTPARNTDAAPVLIGADGVTGRVMSVLSAGASAAAMAPVMDRLWGEATPPASFGTGDLPDSLTFTIRPLAGEGTTSAGGSSADQIIAVHFETGALPAGSWVRLWPHGLDTDTGLRFRQDGGGALADATGQAIVVIPIPDGTAAPTVATDPPVRLSFDALITANGLSRYFSDQRYDRPATSAGARVTLAAPPAIPAGISLWNCEQGAAMGRAANLYQSGQTLVALPDDLTDPFALVDIDSLDASDAALNTLVNAPAAGDTLIITQPAFAQTPEGDLTAAINVSTLVNRTRNLLSHPGTMGQPAPSQERRELAALERTGNTGVIGANLGRAAYHEAPPPQGGHAGVPAGPEIHSPGLAIAGPAADQLAPLMEERRAGDLIEFIGNNGAPVVTTPDPGGTTNWTAILETTTHGIVGDAGVRTFLDNVTFLPGQSWTTLKNDIEAALSIDIDAQIDTTGFDDDALALALDRMILKTRDGAKDFATSAMAAISRAEDFIYIETPAIDPHTAEASVIDFIGAIQTRWATRPGLRVILCIPEKFLPGTNTKVEQIRKAGIAGALNALKTTGQDRVELFSPIAGPGRSTYMATTTVIVDDAILLTGSTHLWRRGLTFDSSLSAALFDETVNFGRPASIRAARLQFMANALGLPLAMMPADPEDCLFAITSLNKAGGLGRVKPARYPPAADPTSAAELSIWNPDGRPGVVTDWFIFFAALTGGTATDFNNAIR